MLCHFYRAWQPHEGSAPCHRATVGWAQVVPWGLWVGMAELRPLPFLLCSLSSPVEPLGTHPVPPPLLLRPCLVVCFLCTIQGHCHYYPQGCPPTSLASLGGGVFLVPPCSGPLHSLPSCPGSEMPRAQPPALLSLSLKPFSWCPPLLQ